MDELKIEEKFIPAHQLPTQKENIPDLGSNILNCPSFIQIMYLVYVTFLH